MFGRRKKCALLIDFDNVLGMTSGEFTTSIAKWLQWLEDGAFDEQRNKREFVVKRVYWNPLYDRYRDVFEAAGFEAFACAAVAKSKKSSADMVITLDAIDIAATKGLKEIILLTSDTDFVPVVNRLQERDLEVVAMGHEQNPTAEVYRKYADHVVLRNDFMDGFKYERPKRKWFGLVRVKPPAPPPTPPPALRAAPLNATPIEQAAARIVVAAQGVGGAMLSRKAVIFALRDLHGFNTGGANAWLGLGSYKKMLLAIAQNRADLRLYSYRNGGVAVAYRAPQPTPEPRR